MSRLGTLHAHEDTTEQAVASRRAALRAALAAGPLLLAFGAAACAGAEAPSRPTAIIVAQSPPAPPLAAPAACRFGDAAGCSAACDAGHPRACNNLGAMYEEGQGVPRDVDRARTLYAQACSGGARGGCANLSHQGDAGSNVVISPGTSSAVTMTPPPPTKAPDTWSTASTATVIVSSANSTCTVDGRSVPCNQVSPSFGSFNVVTEPNGMVSISIGGHQIYSEAPPGREGLP